MKSTQYPIEIAGQKYFINTTWNDAPAIYHSTEFRNCGHVLDGVEGNSYLCPINDDCIVIIARKAPAITNAKE